MLRRSLWLLCLVLTIIFSSYSWAMASQGGSAVLVVIDRINIEDLAKEDLPGFQRLMEEGAVGLLNSNTAGRIIPENTHVTIGAGSHAMGTGLAGFALKEHIKLDEGLASEIYYQRTGRTAPEDGIVHLGIGRITQMNDALPRSITVGTLGESLRQQGYKTAVLGNSDYEGKLVRLAVNIAMDKHGIVDYGLIDGEILINDPGFPGGKRTDYRALLENVQQILRDYQLIVIDLGDTARLYEQRLVLLENAYHGQMTQSIKRADEFLSQLTNSLQPQDLLIVVTPTPAQSMLEQNKMLTPVILWGKGFTNDHGENAGMLISGTTKHPGIVMSTDITPTILSHFNISPAGSVTGRPMYSMAVDFELVSHYLQKQDNLAVTYAARAPFQKTYVFFQIVMVAVSLWLIFVRKRGAKYLKPVILMVVSVPLAYLLLPLLPRPSVPVAAILLILIALLLTAVAIALGRRNFLHSYALLAMATVSMLLIDILLGQPLQKQAILSYDPMAGARFYGIGNEYMGVLIGATIMATSLLINNFPRHQKFLVGLSGLIFVVTVYSMAAPHLGTNVGGTIASSTAFLVTFLLFLGIKFRLKIIAGVVAVVTVLLTSFIAFDLTRPLQQQSHIGQTARLILEGGFTEIWNIINRKVSMNMKLIRYTVWTRVLLASIIALAILFYKPRGIMQTIKDKYPFIFKGFIGVVTGAMVAFAFNDSGVVAAATTMIFGAPPLIYLALEELSERKV